MGQSPLPHGQAQRPALSWLGGPSRQCFAARNAPGFSTSMSRRALALDRLSGMSHGSLDHTGRCRVGSLGPTHASSAPGGCHTAVWAGDVAVTSAVLPPPSHPFPQAPSLPCSALLWVEIAVLKTSSKSSAEQIALSKSRVKVLGFVRVQRKVLDWIFKHLSAALGERG